MAYSKVILNGATIMDVTQDTVAAETLLSGETATRNDGVRITGTYEGGGGVGEIVYEGSLAITADTNLWQYVNLEGDYCVYVVVLQDVYIENHHMDRVSTWTLYVNTMTYDTHQASYMGDSDGDYEYQVGLIIQPFSSETYIDSGASGFGASAFRANVVKIVKFIL